MQSLNMDLKWQLLANGWSDERNISDYHSGSYLRQIGANVFFYLWDVEREGFHVTWPLWGEHFPVEATHFCHQTSLGPTLSLSLSKCLYITNDRCYFYWRRLAVWHGCTSNNNKSKVHGHASCHRLRKKRRESRFGNLRPSWVP